MVPVLNGCGVLGNGGWAHGPNIHSFAKSLDFSLYRYSIRSVGVWGEACPFNSLFLTFALMVRVLLAGILRAPEGYLLEVAKRSQARL